MALDYRIHPLTHPNTSLTPPLTHPLTNIHTHTPSQVRPQTKEALAMALEAKSTIIVALNKVDRIVNPADRKAARSFNHR